MTNSSSAAPDNFTKFQGLLRELFQFDCADLDFGIYRIMNHKRDAVERFISQQLSAHIAAELDCGPLAQQAQAQAKLDEIKQQIRADLSEDAIDPSGNLDSTYHNSTIGKRYLEAQHQAGDSSRSRDAVEADIYNHLYTFFSRYYEEGDFISKRRYSRNQRYAIPYNGEEVYLHWANNDQYYVKSDEYFRNYDWKAANGVSVHFRLRGADVEQNNVKGERRFFIPLVSETEWDAGGSAITIPFEYRPMAGSETATMGKTNQQEALVKTAVTSIPKQVPANSPAQAALISELTKGDETVSHLEHHLRQYVRRNNSDFFIHKDLSGFLNRELDFYLKNEVLNLDDLVTAGQDMSEVWFQQLRLTKALGSQIIDFLAQIEGFQKMLWEKRKFVTETQYCVRVGIVDKEFYADIAACDAQWEEWQELHALDISDRSETFLRAHPTLILDTHNFDADFIDRLLASFENLDEITDGLLVHSENWQALNVSQMRYQGQVKCVHIDPPYNPQSESFVYKNGYPDSSWLAMIRDRIAAGYTWMDPEGFLLCHIDEIEYEELHLLLEGLQIPNIGTMIWDKRNPMTGGGGIATQHEYIICRSSSPSPLLRKTGNRQVILDEAKRISSQNELLSEETKKEFSRWVAENKNFTGGERAYRLINDEGRVYSSVSLRAPELRTDPKFFEPLLHPLTGNPCPVPHNGFSRTPETLQAMIDRNEILFGKDEKTQPRQKRYLQEGSNPQLSSVIQDATRGKASLDALGLSDFPYCHSVSFYETLLGAVLSGTNDLVLDYFAGSGTTGHAVINLNREDGGQRKFVLIEMGDYFNTVLLPRIKKVTYTPEWKAGKPQRMAELEEAERSPRIAKYFRLESYEDALDSIDFGQTSNQMALADTSAKYLLKYMLKWETKSSETLLNVAKLASPFSYRLRVHVNGEQQERNVDLAETFNYLLGLKVRKREVFADNGRRYLVYRGETRDRPGHEVAVIWRETESWNEADFAQDRDFVIQQILAAPADTVYVNGDSAIPDAKAIEPLFKARMFADVYQ